MKKTFVSGLAGMLLGASMLMALDEKELTTKMKAAGDHMNAIRKAMQGGAMADVATHAKGMVSALDGTEGFWKERKMDDAVKFNLDGLEGARALVKAAEGSDNAAARTAASKMGGACKSCHEAHREKVSDGVYRIK
ncbi:MAG: hypothetical protein HY820_27685 [Acidobacteria bacterium]|nr:hypothetical protein [Acidobacteriota bacterium]